jgi:hypothetical protein
MKKYFVFAFAALALAFTACDKHNEPTNSEEITTDVTPAMLAGTTWRVDSSYVEGKLDFMPHLIVEVLNTEKAVFNGSDTLDYRIEGDQLSYGKNEYSNTVTIKRFNKDFAVINFKEMQADLYMALIPKAEGQELPKTAENLFGTWKCQYYDYRYSYYSEATQSFLWDGQKHSDPGVVYLTFNADGTFVATNIVFARMDEQKEYASQTGWWAAQDGKFASGYDEKPAELSDYYLNDIVTLTSNAFYVGKTEESWTGTTQMHYTYYTRVE